MEPKNSKEAFIEELAKYLQDRAVEFSIKLQINPINEEACQWSRLRILTPLFGYPSHEEAVKLLSEFLK